MFGRRAFSVAIHVVWNSYQSIQYRQHSLASRGPNSFRGHIASDTIGKTLASAPFRGSIFLVGAGPLPLPQLAPALRLSARSSAFF